MIQKTDERFRHRVFVRWGAAGLLVLLLAAGCKSATGPKYPDPNDEQDNPRDTDKQGLLITPDGGTWDDSLTSPISDYSRGILA